MTVTQWNSPKAKRDIPVQAKHLRNTKVVLGRLEAATIKYSQVYICVFWIWHWIWSEAKIKIKVEIPAGVVTLEGFSGESKLHCTLPWSKSHWTHSPPSETCLGFMAWLALFHTRCLSIYYSQSFLETFTYKPPHALLSSFDILNKCICVRKSHNTHMHASYASAVFSVLSVCH